MRRKEIFFKKLSFILGVTLIVSFVTGTEVLLPLRSEVRLHQSWGGDFAPSSSELIINQEKNEAHITFFSGSLKVGIIPVAEFNSFWDSLNSLNFWELKNLYIPMRVKLLGIIMPTGKISVSYEKEESLNIFKEIYFSDPNSCPLKLKRVYELMQSMIKFAQNTADSITLQNYQKGKHPIREGTESQEFVKEVKHIYFDPKYLDSLLINLPNDEDYTKWFIQNLGKTRDKKVISAYITALEKEKKKKKLNDEIISKLIQTLTEFTGQNFPFNPSDSLAAKKETINKWINWWKENKDKFK